jgi:transcription-repair coupling factor (superfamily II helicase)
LESLTQALDIFYFPSSFKNKKNYSLLNSSNVMLRTEALTKIASTLAVSLNDGQGVRRKIIVTYPEALFEKVVVPGKLSSNIIYIKTGDVLNTEQLLLQLSDYGFEKTDFVYEPGQFGIRGGIIEIYSFAMKSHTESNCLGMMLTLSALLTETQLSERRLLQ